MLIDVIHVEARPDFSMKLNLKTETKNIST